MNVLCVCESASVLTGSEIYFYELCRSLSELGHRVTLAARNISEDYRKMAQGKFDLCNLKDASTYGIGVVILSHQLSTYETIRLNIVGKPIVNIIHSEIYELEQPLIDSNVIKYVAIRESISDHLVKQYKIPKGKIQMIRNPIDLERFNTIDAKDERYGLFVGTMGGLRIKPAIHFAEFCRANNLRSYYIGSGNEQLHFYDVRLPEQSGIEYFFKRCTVSAGIIHGRTYFEARLCGKKTVEYFMNTKGQITGIDYEDEPTQSELIKLQSEFDRLSVAKKIISF